MADGGLLAEALLRPEPLTEVSYWSALRMVRRHGTIRMAAIHLQSPYTKCLASAVGYLHAQIVVIGPLPTRPSRRILKFVEPVQQAELIYTTDWLGTTNIRIGSTIPVEMHAIWIEETSDDQMMSILSRIVEIPRPLGQALCRSRWAGYFLGSCLGEYRWYEPEMEPYLDDYHVETFLQNRVRYANLPKNLPYIGLSGASAAYVRRSLDGLNSEALTRVFAEVLALPNGEDIIRLIESLFRRLLERIDMSAIEHGCDMPKLARMCIHRRARRGVPGFRALADRIGRPSQRGKD
jgi:hypothetical protein